MIRQHQQTGVTTGVGDPVAGMQYCVFLCSQPVSEVMTVCFGNVLIFVSSSVPEFSSITNFLVQQLTAYSGPESPNICVSCSTHPGVTQQ